MVDEPKNPKEILSGINKSISNNTVNSPFDSSDIRQINKLNYKVKVGKSITDDEIITLKSLSSKIKEVSDNLNTYNVSQDDILSNLINSYKKIIENNNFSLEKRQEALVEFKKLVNSNNILNNTKIPNINSDVNKIIENAKDVKIKNGNLINPKNMEEKYVSPEKDGSNSFSGETSKKPKFSERLSDSSSSLHQNVKSGLDLALGFVGLGKFNQAFDTSSSMISSVSGLLNRRNKNLEPVKDDSINEKENFEQDKLVGDQSSSIKPDLSNIGSQIRYSNKLLEKIFSELRISEDNKSSKKKDDKDKKDNEPTSLLDDLGLDIGSGNGRHSKSKKSKGKIKGKPGRFGRFGRTLGTVGRGAGKLAGGALSLSGVGGLVDLAGEATSLAGQGFNAITSAGSKINSGIGFLANKSGLSSVGSKVGSLASKVGLGGALKVGAKAAKLIPGLGLAATIGSAGLSAYQGYNDKDAEKLFGSKSVSAKVGSSLASVGSDLSFGLISKESIASVEKSIGGGVTSAFNWLIGKKDKEETKEKASSNKDKDLAGFGGMKPEEVKSLFEGFGASISSFIQGIPSILQSFSSILPSLAGSLVPGTGAAVEAAKQVANSNIGETLKSAIGAENNGAWDILTGKSARYGGANDGTIGNTGKGKKLSQVADERTQILYNEAKKSGMSKDQITMMMGQVDHETGGFKFMRELGSRGKPAGSQYEGRKNLGNTQAGDGERFKGRGFNQLTGRANYAWMSKELGIDLVSHPELAEDPRISAKIAVIYHKKRVGNAKSVEEATKAVNGGFKGLGERKEATQKWANIMNSSDNKFEKGYESGSIEKALKDQDQNKTTDSTNKPVEQTNNTENSQSSVIAKVQPSPQQSINVKQVLDDQKQTELAQQSNMLNQSIMRTQDNSNNQSSPVVLNPPKKDTSDTIDDLNLLAARNGLFS